MNYGYSDCIPYAQASVSDHGQKPLLKIPILTEAHAHQVNTYKSVLLTYISVYKSQVLTDICPMFL